MRTLRDFTVGFLSSSLVVALDKLHLFEGASGAPIWVTRHATATLACGAFLLGTLASKLLFSLPQRKPAKLHEALTKTEKLDDIREFHDTFKTDGTGRYEVFYPVTFTKNPTLKISGRALAQYELLEQRPDGFVILVRSVYALSVFDRYGHDLSWSARGQVKPL